MNEIESYKFDYSVLDENTSSFLKTKEIKMKEIVGNAYTQLGKELKEAQDKLALNGYGCFQEWYESLGFKKNKVYDLINRYDLIMKNLDNKELIENLPLSLTYEISKSSTNSELKNKVLNGEISTLKEYRELNNNKEKSRTIPSATKKRIYLKSEGKCEICGFGNVELSSILEMHHIKPYSRNGKNEIDNLVLLCPNCHRILHDNNINVDNLKIFTKKQKKEIRNYKTQLKERIS